MNKALAEELQGVLGVVFPGSGAVVVPETDGAEVVMTVDGLEHRFSIGDGDSALLRMLVSGVIPY